MKNVIILQSRSTTPRIQSTTNATTFGELVNELKLSIDFSSVRVMEANSGQTITSMNDVLPTNIETVNGVTNDLTIIVSPSKKINSGGSETLLTKVNGINVSITITTEDVAAKVAPIVIVRGEDADLSTDELFEKYDLEK